MFKRSRSKERHLLLIDFPFPILSKPFVSSRISDLELCSLFPVPSYRLQSVVLWLFALRLFTQVCEIKPYEFDLFQASTCSKFTEDISEIPFVQELVSDSTYSRALEHKSKIR
ncbi:hypothetical protein LXL04_000599 [Taraxacum kok-saghyz]